MRGVSLRKEFLGTVSTTSQSESDEGEQGEEPLFVLVSRFLVAINAHRRALVWLHATESQRSNEQDSSNG